MTGHARDLSGCVSIRLYNLQDHTEIGTLVQHDGNSFTCVLAVKSTIVTTGSITDLNFFGGSHLVSASEDQTVCIWECGGSWECLHMLKGHK